MAKHPAGYRPQLEPAAIGVLLELPDASHIIRPGPPLYECPRCAALCTYDGLDTHNAWHASHGDQVPL